MSVTQMSPRTPAYGRVALPADFGGHPGVDVLRELILGDTGAARRGLTSVLVHRVDWDRLGQPPLLWFPSGEWVRVSACGRHPGRVHYRYRPRPHASLSAEVAPQNVGRANGESPVPAAAADAVAGRIPEPENGTAGARQAEGDPWAALFERVPTRRQRAAVLALFATWPRVPTRLELMTRLPGLQTPSAATKLLRNVRRRVRPELLAAFDAAVRRTTAGRHAPRVRPMQLGRLENL